MFKSAFGGGSTTDHRQFKQLLGQHYDGQATLAYKGREALELAFRISGLPEGATVGINGFTCYVVYRAIERAGYKPVFIDIAPGQMDFGLDELQQAHDQNQDLAAIIVQNSLGYPVDIKALQTYCAKHKILIIEDGAHSLGAVYTGGQEVGTVGDLAMFSFSQDKPLDVVAGGALIDRRSKPGQQPDLQPVSWRQREINRDYPMWCGLIRGGYPIGLGRGLHYGLKKLHVLTGPMKDAGPGLHNMSIKTARLAVSRWHNRQAELQHRQTIAAIYEKGLPEELQLISKPSGQPSYLRFPLVTDDRAGLVKFLKKHHIYIGDTWYDAPIAPKRYLPQTTYKSGMCPQADRLVDRMVNLPTHININPQQAEYIVRKVKQWQASQ